MAALPSLAGLSLKEHPPAPTSTYPWENLWSRSDVGALIDTAAGVLRRTNETPEDKKAAIETLQKVYNLRVPPPAQKLSNLDRFLTTHAGLRLLLDHFVPGTIYFKDVCGLLADLVEDDRLSRNKHRYQLLEEEIKTEMVLKALLQGNQTVLEWRGTIELVMIVLEQLMRDTFWRGQFEEPSYIEALAVGVRQLGTHPGSEGIACLRILRAAIKETDPIDSDAYDDMVSMRPDEGPVADLVDIYVCVRDARNPATMMPPAIALLHIAGPHEYQINPRGGHDHYARQNMEYLLEPRKNGTLATALVKAGHALDLWKVDYGTSRELLDAKDVLFKIENCIDVYCKEAHIDNPLSDLKQLQEAIARLGEFDNYGDDNLGLKQKVMTEHIPKLDWAVRNEEEDALVIFGAVAVIAKIFKRYAAADSDDTMVQTATTQWMKMKWGDGAITTMLAAMALALKASLLHSDEDYLAEQNYEIYGWKNEVHGGLFRALVPMFVATGTSFKQKRNIAICAANLLRGTTARYEPDVHVEATTTTLANFLKHPLLNPETGIVDNVSTIAILEALDGLWVEDDDVTFLFIYHFAKHRVMETLLSLLAVKSKDILHKLIDVIGQASKTSMQYLDPEDLTLPVQDREDFYTDRVRAPCLDAVSQLVPFLKPGPEEALLCQSAAKALHIMLRWLHGDDMNDEQFGERFMASGGIAASVALLDTDFATSGNYKTLPYSEKAFHLVLEKLLPSLFHQKAFVEGFAVAGGIKKLARLRAVHGYTGNAFAATEVAEQYQHTYEAHLEELSQKLERYGAYPDWIGMLWDVEWALAIRNTHGNLEKNLTKVQTLLAIASDRENKTCTYTLPTTRWGYETANTEASLKRAFVHYGQIYDLLVRYRSARQSEMGYNEVFENCKVFQVMNTLHLLAFASLDTNEVLEVNGKRKTVVNHKPSLLAAEVWATTALSTVLMVDAPVEHGGSSELTVPEQTLAKKLEKMLGICERLMKQYAWAVSHPNPPAHFVEATRDAHRVYDLVQSLAERLSRPTYDDGTFTLLHRVERQEYERMANKRDSEDDDESSDGKGKRQRTRAALRTSIEVLYGRAHTDATMARLFGHLGL